ncbi:GntR family transcriptional regulator [Bradyrhizobium sp. 2TAF24]|uniref:GntR family transcriptional regulator n=1 Tax=Bradyrhizobium sp. 2TAF24 TaxID=3233011 RepID=UPI003F8FD4BF
MGKKPDSKAPTLAHTIAERIRAAIVDAEFEFGEGLSEDTLAAAFEVSRTPVREALNILQMQDLVHIVPKSGTYVFTPKPEDIAELCDHRAGLEVQAVRLALAGGKTTELVRALRAALERMSDAIRRDDLQEYGRADTDFHLAFFAACRNRYLERAYGQILGRVAALRTHLAIKAEGEPERSFRDHQTMIRLIGAKDTARLSRLLVAHILRTKANYLNAFRTMPPGGPSGRALRLRKRLFEQG